MHRALWLVVLGGDAFSDKRGTPVSELFGVQVFLRQYHPTTGGAYIGGLNVNSASSDDLFGEVVFLSPSLSLLVMYPSRDFANARNPTPQTPNF